MRLAIVLITVILALPATASWHDLNGAKQAQSPTITVQDLGGGLKQVDVTIHGLDLSPVTIDGLPHTAVTMPGCVPSVDEGQPALPMLSQAISLPAEGTPRLTVLSAEWTTMSADQPVPSRGDLTRDIDPVGIPFTHGSAYSQDGVWPNETAILGRPFLVHERRGAVLRLYPVRWNATTSTYEVLVSMSLSLETTGHGGINTARVETATSKAFAPVYRTLFTAELNSDKAEGDDQGPGHGYGESERMLIISDPTLVSSAQDFAAWKRECGLTVDVVTMDDVGGDVIGMRGAISDRFFSDEGLAYLVLLGDVEAVPTNYGTYQGADSDGMYGLLAGDDLYVDILVSRLPARNLSHARTMVDRSLAYERDVTVDADWLGRAVGIASDEGSPADWERAEDLRDQLLAADYTDVDRIYQSFGGSRDGITTAVNAGRGLVNYLGHGSGNAWLSVPFDNEDVHDLTNTDGWPVIIDVSCTNGDFSQTECFAEAWLRADHAGEPAGAVAMISASTPTSWVPPCVMQETMVDELIAGQQQDLGAVYTAGVAAVLVQYDGLSLALKLMEQYNLFGDCSLQVRTRAPETMAVAHASNLQAGTAALSVTVPAGARAVLSDGDVVLARADAVDAATVQLVPSRPLVDGETVHLTVTARNAVTYQADLTVNNLATPVVEEMPAMAGLLGNYPNPFNPSTTVRFTQPQTGAVRLSINDARGRLVRILVDESLAAGDHEIRWNGRDGSGRNVASGIYLARLVTANGDDVLKMILTK